MMLITYPQVWADEDVLAVQPQDASVLPGDHQQHQRRSGSPLPGSKLLLQWGEQTAGHGGTWHGGGEHGEHSTGPCIYKAAAYCCRSTFWVHGKQVTSSLAAVISLARPKYAPIRVCVPFATGPSGHSFDVFRARLRQALRTCFGQWTCGCPAAKLWWVGAICTHEWRQKEWAGVTVAPVISLLILVQHLFFLSHRVTETSLSLKKDWWGKTITFSLLCASRWALHYISGVERNTDSENCKTAQKPAEALGDWWLRHTGGLLSA